MDWARLPAYTTGTVDRELLLLIEYLIADDRILRVQMKTRLPLSVAVRGNACQDRSSAGSMI